MISFDTAGDFFDYRSPPDLNRVARWDGSSWQPVGSGLGTGRFDSVRDFTIAANGDLVAGGSFEETGEGVEVNYVARWDGTSWQPIGNGLANSVSIIATAANGDLIAAGGYFEGNFEFGYVSRWNGSAWNPVGQELNGRIAALVIDGNGDLIVGGYFTETTDGAVTELNNIARWNGSSWEALGTGFGDLFSSGFTRTLALTIDASGTLIAGGGFTRTADGSVTGLNNVARWNPE